MAEIVLSPERIRELQTSQRELHDLIPELDKAEACGIECQELRAIHQEAHDRITKLLQHYGKRGGGR